MTATYAERLAALTAERGRLCVGIDPMPGVLDAWGLATTREILGTPAPSRLVPSD